MTPEFPRILQGLMENRRLSPKALSYASGCARSTIHQLLSGRTVPNLDFLRRVSLALQIPLADLIVISGVPVESKSDLPAPHPAADEIGRLIAAVSHLSPAQVEQLIEITGKMSAHTPQTTEEE
ncbi:MULTISPECIES: helix-turn-helix domain-containing protein [unclassified Solwaraspora]|uniref:helix-turn-helix domain-containing protein n=1 Tax=unclassified Solwaraspora TaxID=2627926 RepID=UPI00249BAFBD|nr:MULTISPECIES: helix-turn-helix domain-containing protein [unclassified Solwaraspora]WFE23592.1 helix-turn-helix domain-containing protein [Solwaraspora sp. WMMD937]WJK32389.1 helix-turn-helix domain-containing protein [Solwaraspora sp. WMMA2065]